MAFAEISPTFKISKCSQVGSSQFALWPKCSGGSVLWVTASRARGGEQETRSTSEVHWQTWDWAYTKHDEFLMSMYIFEYTVSRTNKKHPVRSVFKSRTEQWALLLLWMMHRRVLEQLLLLLLLGLTYIYVYKVIYNRQDLSNTTQFPSHGAESTGAVSAQLKTTQSITWALHSDTQSHCSDHHSRLHGSRRRTALSLDDWKQKGKAPCSKER